jgi:tRNA nucleotidyltransferase (CCA-adding enzyme)
MSRPYLMGRDLLAAGLKPGALFREALEQAHKLRLAGLSKEEQFKAALAFLHGKDGEGGGAP